MLLVGVVLAVVIIGAFFLREGFEHSGSAVAQDSSGGMIPSVSLENPAGEQKMLHDVVSKRSIVNVWASWCPFCVEELPVFNEFAKEHQDILNVIVVNRGESREKGTKFLSSLNLNESSLKIFYDRDENLYQGFGGFSMPETLFVEANGDIRFHKRGPLSSEELETIITNLDWN